MVIVGGWFEVDPSERRVLTAQAERIRRLRAEQGCIEYVIAAESGRTGTGGAVRALGESGRPRRAPGGLVERTEVGRPAGRPTAMSIVVYDVSGERTMV